MQFFFTQLVPVFFSKIDDQAMHDEWRQGSGSNRSAGGRERNSTSASGPSVPYRGQCVAFPPEFLFHNNLEVATLRELVDAVGVEVAVGVEEEVDWDMGHTRLLVYKHLQK